MTSITTPTPTGTHHLRTALIAVLVALFATGIALGAWTLVESGTDGPAGDPTELTAEEEARIMKAASTGSAG